MHRCMHAKSLQSYPTLCDLTDCSPLGSSIHGVHSGEEYWSGVPFPTPRDLPDPGIEPMSLAPPALAGGLLLTKYCQL